LSDAHDSDPPTDGLVAGRFRVGGLLGSGGTASVFAATDTVTGRAVAIKLLHPHLSASEPLRAAFLAEARRTAAVQHPSIVEVLDVGTFEDGGRPIAWIAQELIEGSTLAEHVRSAGPLAAVSAVRVVTAVLAALEAAHADGLVHRDVSPVNILVRFADGMPTQVKLLDFGLADVSGATTLGGDVLRSSAGEGVMGVVGNVNYASPEQLRGEPVDRRGDLYQVGGLLYFALTGRNPFESDDRDAVIRAHLQAPPPVPSVQARGVTPQLDRVIVRAMLKDADDRYADAGEMRVALEQAVIVRAPVSRTTVTRVLGAPTVEPASAATLAATDTATGATARMSEAAVNRDERPGWGVALAVVTVLVVVAIAIPMIASANRPAPAPLASSAPSATPPPTVSASPTATTAPAPALAVVPALGTLDDTLRALAAAGLTAGEVTWADSSLPEGTVLAADPTSGASITRGSVVSLTVASGSNAVPSVGGTDAAGAAAAVRSAGFEPRQSTVIADRPGGSVVGTDPASGTALRLGSAVTVLVAAERAPTPTPTPTPTATPVPTPTLPAPTPTGGAPR
jgi:serine/threonine-protein kinase